MKVIILMIIGGFWSVSVWAKKPSKVVIQDNQEITFEGRNLEGDLNSPGGFYVDVDPRQKFDPLTRKRRDFRREMLRDSIQSQ
jgi:hypothetical protein